LTITAKLGLRRKAYICLTDRTLDSGHETVIVPTPDDANGTAILDWKTATSSASRSSTPTMQRK
jgi:hypothetical protein